MKKDLLVDVDEVIVFSGFLEAVNAFLGTNYQIDDFTTYYIDEAVIPKEMMQEFNEFLHHRNLYENASLLPGAIETLRKLSEEYNIYLLTACVNPFDIEGSGKVFQDKYNFLVKNLPFIKPENFIFTSAKHLFKVYAKIDDRESNLTDDDIEVKILFPSYHNKDIKDEELTELGIIRAGYDWRTGWQNIENLLLKGLNKDTNTIDRNLIKR